MAGSLKSQGYAFKVTQLPRTEAVVLSAGSGPCQVALCTQEQPYATDGAVLEQMRHQLAKKSSLTLVVLGL